MKPMSESLRDLAARPEGAGDSAAEVPEQNFAALQVRRKQFGTAVDNEVSLARGEADKLVAGR
jgi:hypothetical protein